MANNLIWRRYFLKAGAIALLMGGAAMLAVNIEQSPARGLPVEEISIETETGKTVTLEMEIAESPVDLQVGLMYRKEMDENRGMFFLMGRTPAVTSFWMKNTFLPLDILFVDKDGRIAHIHRNATPHSLTPISSREPVIAVIEINAGRADELGIAIGDKVVHRYFAATH